MRECDFLIIGAGIAGTSCGNWLSRDHSVILLEMEAHPGYHTTGRSVAVYTEAYGPRTVRALAKSGFSFLTAPPSSFTDVALSRPFGFLFIAREDQLASLDAALGAVQELSPDISMISPDEAAAKVPVLRRDYLAGAFLDPNALSLDVNAIHQGYIRGLKSHGGEIVCNAAVSELTRKNGKWHVTTPQGEFAAPVVINAAGAWADVVAEMAGTGTIGLVPKRRTVIATIPANVAVDDSWPLVMDTDEEFYFKVDAGTVLGSPADETPVPPQDVQPEEIDIAYVVDKLQTATTMEIRRLQRSWAGLRSFVADGVPVAGYAPDVDGFFWCAGQGGYGIETSYGMGRCSAALAVGDDLPADVRAFGVAAGDLSPERL